MKHLAVALLFLTAVSIGTIVAVHNNPVQATPLANFNPGNIMEDAVMSNKNTMSVNQIQAFLNSKNPCNNTNIHMAAWYPNLQYTIRDGKFVCMGQDTFNGKSAAQIIWQAAQDFSINPQVLIVLLEKEQGLITDTWPNNVQYRTATGYGCPDTAPCDAQYWGLENQIRLAAKLFHEVLNGGWTNYPVGNNYIQYHPDTSCGGSIVNIQNRATSALYRYTPYQPSNAALAAGWGTAPSCGAYGNRNFYHLFYIWFGNPNPQTGSQQISDRYQTLGGASGKLGAPVGDLTYVSSDYRSYQQYEKGIIVWTASSGAWEVINGPIRDRLNQVGGTSGKLGFPTGPHNCPTGKTYCVQAYQNGVIISNPSTGTWENIGSIRQKFVEHGSVSGKLGFPTGPHNCPTGKTYCVQAYQNGVIINDPDSGTWENIGKIREKFIELGSVNGDLGFPTGPHNCPTGTTYCVQAYQNGAIISDSKNGTWENINNIRQRFVELGSVSGVLGFPTGSMNCISTSTYCVQPFQNGAIIDNPDTGTWENYGAIRQKFVELGSVSGVLGFPIGPIETSVNQQKQRFEGGNIIRSLSTGKVTVEYAP